MDLRYCPAGLWNRKNQVSTTLAGWPGCARSAGDGGRPESTP